MVISIRILLTGSSGFLGRYVASALAEDGHEVFCGYLKNMPEFNPIRADLSKPFTTPLDVDIIIHAAAFVPPPGESYSTQEVVENNIASTANLVYFASKTKVKKFILVSSLSILAKHPSDYGSSKIASEKLVRESELDYSILRFSSIYGPRQNDRWPIPKMIRSVFAGTPFQPTNRSNDYIFVRDASKAISASIPINENILNIFSGIQISDRAVIREIATICGKSSSAGFENDVRPPNPFGEPKFQKLNLGLTPFSVGLKETVQYFRHRYCHCSDTEL